MRKSDAPKSDTRKSDTRTRITDAAGTLFRQHGIDGVGVDAIMRAAGLTHGGFYGHFPSKEALVAEVSAATLARSAERWERISSEAAPAEALKQIVGSYLDPAHVAVAERSCVLTTLGPEMARRAEQRPAITASIRRMLKVIERCTPEGAPDTAEAALSCMVGAVVLARLADDSELAEGFLDAARQAVVHPKATGKIGDT